MVSRFSRLQHWACRVWILTVDLLSLTGYLILKIVSFSGLRKEQIRCMSPLAIPPEQALIYMPRLYLQQWLLAA